MSRCVERNPGIIMVSGSVFGQTGPLAQEWGVDGTGGALSGRTFLTGWPDGDPVIPGAVPYGDVIVPYVMAAAVRRGARSIGARTARGCTSMPPCTRSACSRCVPRCSPRRPAGRRRGRAGNTDPAVFHRGSTRSGRRAIGWVADCSARPARPAGRRMMLAGGARGADRRAAL